MVQEQQMKYQLMKKNFQTDNQVQQSSTNVIHTLLNLYMHN